MQRYMGEIEEDTILAFVTFIEAKLITVTFSEIDLHLLRMSCMRFY